MWTKEDVKKFYATVGQRTQMKEYKTPKIDEYHKLEEEEIYKLVKEGSKVLEAGCGQGRIIDLLKDKVSEIVGVEYVPEVAEKTAERFKDYDNVKIICGDVCEMPYLDDESFDYVLCTFNTLGTIPHPHDLYAVEEMKRVLKKGGKLVLSVYSKEALEEQLELYRKANWDVIKYDDEAVYTSEGLVSRRYDKADLLLYFINDDNNFDINIRKLNEVSWFLVAEKKGGDGEDRQDY